MNRILIALFMKDLCAEFRTKESFLLLVALAILLSAVASFGVANAFLPPDNIRSLFPALVWIVFVFGATVSIGRSFEYEMGQRAIDGILMTGIAPGYLFTAKTLSNLILVFAGHLVALAALAVLLDIGIVQLLPSLLGISFLVLLGYVPLATLLAGLSMSSRLRGMLLPLILLPLVFPLFFAGIELWGQILESRPAISSPWFPLLLLVDAVYCAVCAILFPYAIEEVL